MEKIKSLEDLKKRREELQANLKLREQGDNVNNLTQVKVAMGTCGIAAGAKETMNVIIDECNKRNLAVVVTQTGCVGHCDAEPVVEVIKPGKEAVLFGHVDAKRAAELVEKYIVAGEMIDKAL